MSPKEVNRQYERSVLLEEAYGIGKLMFIKDPKIGPDGIKLDRQLDMDHDILVYFVSQSKTKLIGYVCYNFYDGHCIGSGIGIIDESFKRKRIGSKLLSLVENDCMRNHLRRIEVPSVEPVAKSFLIFNGYEEVNGRFIKVV